MQEVLWPLWVDRRRPAGRITQHFGNPNDRYKKYGFSKHNGEDIAGVPLGHDVLGEAGFIERVALDAGYGWNIKIRLALGYVRYAHLLVVSVGQGKTIERGEVIGKLGSTGDSTGPHVHVEFEPFNPNRANGTLGREAFAFTYDRDEKVIILPEEDDMGIFKDKEEYERITAKAVATGMSEAKTLKGKLDYMSHTARSVAIGDMIATYQASKAAGAPISYTFFQRKADGVISVGAPMGKPDAVYAIDTETFLALGGVLSKVKRY